MQQSHQQPSVFFDIGDTLGVARVSLPPVRLVGLDVFDHVPPILTSLRDREISMGIISNTGEEPGQDVIRVLQDAAIWHFFDPQLVLFSSVVGLEKNSPEIFLLAARRAGQLNHPEACIFVGEDSRERQFALQAGLRVSPHPNLLPEVLAGRAVHYLRVTPPEPSAPGWRGVLGQLPIVTYPSTERAGWLLAMGSSRSAAQLDDLGFLVDRLGSAGAPDTTDLYLQRDDKQTRTGFLAPEGQAADAFGIGRLATCVLTSSPEGMYLALPAMQSIDDLHFREAQHGHTQKMIPDWGSLHALDPTELQAAWSGLAAVEPELSHEELQHLQSVVSTENVARWHARYAGVEPPVVGGSALVSRHIRHPDNNRAVEALVSDLQRLGEPELLVRIHPFTHEGRTLLNVEAELPGSDRSKVVIVSAHLDSTAAFNETPFDPLVDPAPGADDDASGLAAVLAIAEAVMKLRQGQPLKRTIRFVLFNAEEQGLVGSQHYARAQFMAGVHIAAVYQIDMIGHSGDNDTPPRPFEVHAGFPASANVQEQSRLLAERIKRLTPKVSPNLRPPQIYTIGDPAAGRSDHASFQQRGYAACIASEDFFVGPLPTSPQPQPNPNYHKSTDKQVNRAYMADIARVLAAATWVTARIE